jgi:hypothetical protein
MTDVPPIVLSTIVCDRVLLDAPTKMSSLISIRDGIVAAKYPARHPQLFFFAEMTNGHEDTQITVRLVDVQNNDKVMAEKTSKVKFDDVKRVVTIVLGFEGLVFPHTGEYYFQLYAGQELLSSRRIVCLQIKPGRKNDPNQQ